MDEQFYFISVLFLEDVVFFLTFFNYFQTINFFFFSSFLSLSTSLSFSLSFFFCLFVCLFFFGGGGGGGGG